jgi:outer membrane protein assembly factor BamB
MMKNILLLSSAVCLLLTTGFALAEDAVSNWPQFRGADSTGVSANRNLPDQWSATENVEWKADIPGRGWGSPVVWGDRVFLSTVVNTGGTERLKKGLYMGGERPDIPKTKHQWKVICLDLASGKPLWEKIVREGTPTAPIHLKNSYASETPVTDGDHLYVCFGNVGIYCFDMAGNEVWKHDLTVQPMRLGWGTASSPALHGNVLYYQNDNDQHSELLALDKRTGSKLWSVDREEKSNWSSPFIWVHDARTEIVTLGSKAVRSYDLDGKLLWSLKGMSSITIATPYAVNGLLYISSGYVLDPTKAMYVIKPGAIGDLTLPKGQTSNEFIVWSNMGIAPYNPSTLVSTGRLFVLYDRGYINCFNAMSGEMIYEKEVIKRGSGYTASPWAYDGKLFCLDEDGVCTVVKEGDKMEILHTNSLAEDDICLSTPAMVGERLLIRTDKRLYSIRQRAEAK